MEETEYDRLKAQKDVIVRKQTKRHNNSTPKFTMRKAGVKMGSVIAETCITEDVYGILRKIWKIDSYFRNKSFSEFLGNLFSNGIFTAVDNYEEGNDE